MHPWQEIALLCFAGLSALCGVVSAVYRIVNAVYGVKTFLVKGTPNTPAAQQSVESSPPSSSALAAPAIPISTGSAVSPPVAPSAQTQTALQTALLGLANAATLSANFVGQPTPQIEASQAFSALSNYANILAGLLAAQAPLPSKLPPLLRARLRAQEVGVGVRAGAWALLAASKEL